MKEKINRTKEKIEVFCKENPEVVAIGIAGGILLFALGKRIGYKNHDKIQRKQLVKYMSDRGFKTLDITMALSK